MRRLFHRLSVAAISFAVSTPAVAETIRVGATSGPHAQILEAVVPVAKSRGLDIKIVEFSDGTMINPATDSGEIDANAFQHTPYLDRQNRDRHLDVVSVARTVLMPITAYSKRHATVAGLPRGGEIAIPNDPTNSGRALKLLEGSGLLRLKPGTGFEATVFDIIDNPNGFRITELEAAQIPRVLADVDLGVINTNYAIRAGLDPRKDALLRENELSDYFCLIGVARRNVEQPWVKTLVESFRSDEVKTFIIGTFKGDILAGW
ncbi:D-methionine-binding lipoprotein MetQ precursor [Blastochloris viridis]|uniref:D-methionine-binding lipoprotein metQ n=1 Tax=Blastochloris viridis TaxID=1079 RepID=A0A0H5BEV9_BLAVI|nr:MetQ/NlpA family ABC transporter substrate-binding protein [Blastochloris viridis]ALK09363.1 D-methionine-binding lipoprotein MetQ precursor [Blastochloris viridis]BAS00758.1 methionine ABC transporter substrate-binding protein [Blastochloris viridis]CUU42026.1 D-methionine-binding lipoprotein metQ precursor [Blastochloris viridis]